ncbi:MAG: hypothetical protein H0V70_29945 [Ktedonobacteraceae bacterium]|nr:hypothetical protein [Ktedonobacteraceae bacterium]
MAQVSGIGGVFIYSNDPKSLAEWYANHFGIEFEADKKEENFWMLYVLVSISSSSHRVKNCNDHPA